MTHDGALLSQGIDRANMNSRRDEGFAIKP